MYEFLQFMVRYIPFWCVPGFFIFMPFGYLFWLKDVRTLAAFFFACGLVCSLFVFFWAYSGGPDVAVQNFINAVRSF